MASAARWRRRPVPVLLAILAIPATIAVAVAIRPTGLAEVLLFALVEVVGVSLLAGRRVAGLTAVGTVAAVNWFLVPPYGTFAISAQENLATLLVFLLLAVGVSTGVDAVVNSEAEAAASEERQAALSAVLRPDQRSAGDALEAFRSTFDLTGAALLDTTSGEHLLSAGELVGSGPVFAVNVEPHYSVQGFGDEVLGRRPEFTRSMATAVVASWEGERLPLEKARSERLSEIDQARAALLASIGHDLRTPLAGMRLSAEALQVSGAQMSQQEQAEVIADLRESAIRLDEVLGAVLDSSRIEAGVQPVTLTAVDLVEVARRAVDVWNSPRINMVVPEREVMVMTDATVLERIVTNLVSNALTHTPPDSPIDVVCRPGSITVVDHGPGMTDVAVDQGRSRTGMGMLIVERLASALRARIDYTPTPGGGVTATLILPVEGPDRT